ncbi:sodium:solute symporter family protein [Candidatus Cardinium hertigii]|uniref:Bifunctional (P)ppGpp synthase/hydrolase SpoT n=1 Tax=Candidatus Cardinium hertigii TaxID=247481 RepID=A0A2Z3LGS0_9BACT|nr:sodium:solute symporter family protein [Candidatus Cardinium hertigii]AWN81584.1 Bifunctional (p)ppGpp synthase/hydrolase SpoT [Candidatus Cardinium hertigii]
MAIGQPIHYIDSLLIGIFLLLTLAIGLYYGKDIKTFQEYAVGNRKMSSMTLTTSLIATIYSAKSFYIGFNQHYQHGIYALKYVSGPLSVYLASKFLIVRMKEFIGNRSMAESMGTIYGPAVRILTALLGIVLCAIILAAQIKCGLLITTKLFPYYNTEYHTIIVFLLIICYATFGGIRAVALTDVYQFFFFSLYFPLLICTLLYYSNDLLIDWKRITALPQFNLNKVFTWDDTLKDTLSWLFWWSLVISCNPAYIQRFYMASTVQQAVKVFRNSSLIRLLFFTPLFLLTAIFFHLKKNGTYPYQNILSYIIHLSYWPGMQGILATTCFALLMSTADSILHIASVLFTNDIWSVLTKANKHKAAQHQLTVARITSVVIGFISLTIAFSLTSIITFLEKTGMTFFYHLSVSIPFIITCLGFRPRSIVIFIAMCFNTMMGIYIYYYNLKDHLTIILIASILSLFIPHYLFPKLPNTGWVGVKDNTAWKLQNQLIKRWWQTKWQRIKMPFTSSYQAIIFPKRTSTFMLLGAYLIISSVLALYLIHKAYFLPYVYLYMTVMAIGTIIAIYPAFHSYKKEGSPLLYKLWPTLLFLLLFIIPFQFVKLSHYTPTVCAVLIFNVGLTSVLLSLENSITMLFLTIGIHQFIPPYLDFSNLLLTNSSNVTSIELIVTTAIITITLVGFGIYKQLRDKSVSKGKIMEITRAYEQRIALEAIYSQAHWAKLDATAGGNLLREMGHALQETSEALYKQDPTGLRNEIAFFNKKLQKFSDCLLWRAQEERSLKLNKKSIQLIPLESTILKVNQQILDLGEPLALLLRKQTPIAEIVVDPTLLACLLLLNLWEISKSQQATDHIVTLTLAATTLQYGLATETAADLPSLTLPALAFCFSTDTSLPNLKPSYSIVGMNANVTLPASEAQFYQLESKQIVEAHGGYVEIIESPTKVSCLYVFPLDGRKVMRFKTYDPVDLLANTLAETEESLAQEQELIGLLTTQTTLSAERIQQTIAFIKNAHGLVRRKSGAPYYTHPMAVAKLLLKTTQDPDTILAGLLHDIVEDTPVTLHQLELMYGSEVAAVVDQVTHFNTNGYPWELDKLENKNILHQCRDIRVVQVKLADRLHNMSTLSARKPADQQRIAKETLAFYIPWGTKHHVPQRWLAEMQRICEEVLK